MDNLFDWIRYHKKYDILIFITLYLIIPIIPFISSPIGVFTRESAKLFLSYYATILGGLSSGLLTLFGVWWTIKDQNNKRIIDEAKNDDIRKEDLAVQYRPIISIDVSLHEIIDKNDEHGLVLKIDEYNIGRGEAINVCGKMYDNNQLIATLNPAPFIPSNMNKTISETLLDVIFDYTNIPSHQLFIEITYTDLYGIYQYKFTSRIDIFYDRFKSDNPAIVTSDKRIDVERI